MAKEIGGNVHRYSHLRRIAVWALLDALVVLGAYTAAFFARAIVTPLDYLQSFGFILFAVVVTLLLMYAFGVYHRIWSRTSGHEVTIIVNAVAASTVVTAAVEMVVAPSRPLPLSVIIVGNVLALTGFVAARYRSRLGSGLLWRWKVIWQEELPPSVVRVLIVGAGESGQTFVWRLKHRWSGAGDRVYQVVGFVDDDPEKRGLYIEGCRVLGTRADIPQLAEKYRVDLIILAIHNISGPDFREILAYCESTKARIQVVPDTFALMNATQGVPLLRNVQPEDILGRSPIGRHEAVDFSPVTGRVVLVTGAAGSIGSELSRQMLSYNPTTLILLDNNESGLHDLITELSNRLPETTTLVPVLADITHREALAWVFAYHKPQLIFHAAAYKHVPMLELYPYEAIRVNIGGTWKVAQLAREHGAERFVLISTDKAVDPASVMGATKRVCELLMHALAQQPGGQTLFTSVRFGNVLGSRGSVVPTFERQIDAGGPVTVTHKDMTRYFMTISEAVNLVIHAACLTKGDDLFMLKMGEVVRILDLAERMIRMRGLRPYQDISIRFTGIRPGEKLHEELQHGTETLVPTVHPNIVQLVNQEQRFNASAFLEYVNMLVFSYGAQVADFARHARVLRSETGMVFRHAEHTALASLRTAIDLAFSANGAAATSPELRSVVQPWMLATPHEEAGLFVVDWAAKQVSVVDWTPGMQRLRVADMVS